MEDGHQRNLSFVTWSGSKDTLNRSDMTKLLNVPEVLGTVHIKKLTFWYSCHYFLKIVDVPKSDCMKFCISEAILSLLLSKFCQGSRVNRRVGLHRSDYRRWKHQNLFKVR